MEHHIVQLSPVQVWFTALINNSLIQYDIYTTARSGETRMICFSWCPVWRGTVLMLEINMNSVYPHRLFDQEYFQNLVYHYFDYLYCSLVMSWFLVRCSLTWRTSEELYTLQALCCGFVIAMPFTHIIQTQFTVTGCQCRCGNPDEYGKINHSHSKTKVHKPYANIMAHIL